MVQKLPKVLKKTTDKHPHLKEFLKNIWFHTVDSKSNCTMSDLE